MASRKEIVDYIVEQSARAGAVSARKMFGEFAVYCDQKVVALVCDDRLFIKPTEAGRQFIGTIEEAAPYTGAKPYFLVAEDYWEDSAWLSKLIKLTAAELPLPKPKKPRAAK